MSDEHLERALQAMKEEDVDAGTLDAARARVWDTMRTAVDGTCAEFREDFRAYLAGALGGGRRVLLDDHRQPLPRLPPPLAEMKGNARVVAMPQRSSSRMAALENPRPRPPRWFLGPVSRTRHPRRLDGAGRPAGDGRLRRAAVCTA